MTTYPPCPVCGYNGLTRAIDDYALCPCCYTQFGYSEVGRGYKTLRHHWIMEGALWREGEDTRPPDYNAIAQLRNIGYKPGPDELVAIIDSDKLTLDRFDLPKGVKNFVAVMSTKTTKTTIKIILDRKTQDRVSFRVKDNQISALHPV